MKMALLFSGLSLLAYSSEGFPATLTSKKSGDLKESSTWGGKLPRQGDNIIIQSGHTITYKKGKEGLFSKSITINKGGIFKPAGSISKVNFVLDGGTFDATGKLSFIEDADFKVKTNSFIYFKGQPQLKRMNISGSGRLELKCTGNGATLIFNDSDFSNYNGDIFGGNDLNSSSLIFSGKSRNLYSVPITFDLKKGNKWANLIFPDGLNTNAKIDLTYRSTIDFGNSAISVPLGSINLKSAIAPGTYLPENTNDYALLPLANKGRKKKKDSVAGMFDLKKYIVDESISSSSLTFLPETKPKNRYDLGDVLKPTTKDLDVLLNGGTVKITGKQTINGTLTMINNSTIELGKGAELIFGKGTLIGAGDLEFTGEGTIHFNEDFSLEQYSGKLSTLYLKKKLVININTDLGLSRLALLGEAPIEINTNTGGFISSGKIIFENPNAKFTARGDVIIGKKSIVKATIDSGKSTKEISVELFPGDYSPNAVVSRTYMRKGNNSSITDTPHDLSKNFPNAKRILVVDDLGIPSCQSSGRISDAAVWNGAPPHSLPNAIFEVHHGNFSGGNFPAGLALGREGELVLTDNLTTYNSELHFRKGTLVHNTAKHLRVDADIILDHHENPYAYDFPGTIVLNGGDLTVNGSILGARNRMSFLHIERSIPGKSKLTITGDMKTPPMCQAFDIYVEKYKGELELEFTGKRLNDAHIEFKPKSGLVRLKGGTDSPRAAIRLPENKNVKLDLDNSLCAIMVNSTIGGKYLMRGEYTANNTSNFTAVPELNTGKTVDLTPYLVNYQKATLQIHTPDVNLDTVQVFDTSHFYAPDAHFAPGTKEDIIKYIKELNAPVRKAVKENIPFYKAYGEPMTHTHFTYGPYNDRVQSTWYAYLMCDKPDELLDELLLHAEFQMQLRRYRDFNPEKIEDNLRQHYAPTEDIMGTTFSILNLVPIFIWERELAKKGSVSPKLLAKAEEIYQYSWWGFDKNNPLIGMKYLFLGDGKLNEDGIPMQQLNREKFTWNGNSGAWVWTASFIKATEIRKKLTGKNEFEAHAEALKKGTEYSIDYLFKSSSQATLDGKPFLWWPYNMKHPEPSRILGKGPGWKDGKYKGIEQFTGAEDIAHAQGETEAFFNVRLIEPNRFGITAERYQKLMNGIFYYGINSKWGARGITNPFRVEFANMKPTGGNEKTGRIRQCCTVINHLAYRSLLMKVGRVRGGDVEKEGKIVKGKKVKTKLNFRALFTKWVYQNYDRLNP